MTRRSVRILGSRGIPATHGGFETFAEHLALYLVQRGWQVTVYCQEQGRGPMAEDQWRGVGRVRIPVASNGSMASMLFDWHATRHAAQHRDLCLTLGYNTAIFCALLRARGVPNLINMDGVEWRRGKWGAVAKSWFWLNDWAGCWLGDHLVADHPEIARHLGTRGVAAKTSVIAYGAPEVVAAPLEPLQKLGLQPGGFLTVIARPEPENSLLEVVRGFSRRPRGLKLVVLGKYDGQNAYHQAVQAAASAEVSFVGPIYDRHVVEALRFHSLAYVHGHQVGGTNPSLVEALGAGNPVVAHDNRYNRWVASEAAAYFADESQFDAVLTALLAEPARLQTMRAAARERFASAFTWNAVLADYESLLERFLPAAAAGRGAG